MLMLSVTGLATLSPIPFFSAALYFCYVAPLAVLAAACLLTSMEHTSQFVLGAASRLLPSIRHPTAQSKFESCGSDGTIDALTRGSVSVYPKEAQLYQELIPVIQSHALGSFTYATPDCPEIYYLSGLRNPTRTPVRFLGRPGGSRNATNSARSAKLRS